MYAYLRSNIKISFIESRLVLSKKKTIRNVESLEYLRKSGHKDLIYSMP